MGKNKTEILVKKAVKANIRKSAPIIRKVINVLKAISLT